MSAFEIGRGRGLSSGDPLFHPALVPADLVGAAPLVVVVELIFCVILDDRVFVAVIGLVLALVDAYHGPHVLSEAGRAWSARRV